MYGAIKAIIVSSILSFVLIIFSCNTEEPQETITMQNGPPGVYVGGQDENAYAAVWKDGSPTQLPGFNARAEYVFVNGTDVYFAGRTFTGGINSNSFVYWKNGSSNTILEGSSKNTDDQLRGFTVSGNDLHAIWNEYSGSFSIIKHWKNGVVTSITNANHFSKAYSLAVYGKDVYICGSESSGGFAVAKYWKNGKEVSLSDGKTNAAATSIFIYRGDIYVAGVVSSSPDISTSVEIPKYWKNGVATNLSDGTKNESVHSIFVDESGVYVAGSETSATIRVAKYWKNGIAIPLTDGSMQSSANQIWVSDNDIYVVGREGAIGTVWKNGSRQPPFNTNNPGLLPLCISVIR